MQSCELEMAHKTPSCAELLSPTREPGRTWMWAESRRLLALAAPAHRLTDQARLRELVSSRYEAKELSASRKSCLNKEITAMAIRVWKAFLNQPGKVQLPSDDPLVVAVLLREVPDELLHCYTWDHSFIYDAHPRLVQEYECRLRQLTAIDGFCRWLERAASISATSPEVQEFAAFYKQSAVSVKARAWILDIHGTLSYRNAVKLLDPETLTMVDLARHTLAWSQEFLTVVGSGRYIAVRACVCIIRARWSSPLNRKPTANSCPVSL